MISVKNNKTGVVTVCCISVASDIIGVERKSIYDLKKKGNPEEIYRHFTINWEVKIIKLKARGKHLT